MKNKINLFLIEDHPAIITGIKGHLKEIQDPLFEFVGEARTPAEATNFLDFEATSFEGIVVLDIGLGGHPMFGYDFAKAAKEKGQDKLRIIVYSMRDEIGVIRKMIEAGVSGYIDKNSNLETLYEGMVQVAEGEDFYSRGSVSKAVSFMIKNPKPNHTFTQAEQEIIQLMRLGHLTYKAIADELDRSPRTVEQHLKHLYEKSGTTNMASLLAWIMQQDFD